MFYRDLTGHTSSTLHMLLSASAAGLVACTVSACAGDRAEPAPAGDASETAVAAVNTLTSQEQAEGWILLFDGESFENWRGIGQDSIPAQHWVIEDGTLHKVASGKVPVAPDGQPLRGGDLITVDTYDNFEFAFDFKLSPGANSGVKYNVSEEMSLRNPMARAALGFEYQVLDDSLHPDAKMGVNGNRTAAALYDMIPPNANKKMKPTGEWNQGRIVKQGNHVEHWLNGEKVVEYEIGSEEFNQYLAASKYKDIQGFADNRKGHIVLQDHNDDVWYRNIKVRPLPAEQ